MSLVRSLGNLQPGRAGGGRGMRLPGRCGAFMPRLGRKMCLGPVVFRRATVM